MRHTTTARSVAATLAVLAAISFESAYADVTIEERITVQGAGAMSVGNMSGTTVKSVSGDRAREESHIQMESQLVRFFARGAAAAGTAQLIRLDEDKIYSLDLGKKEYTETSLAEKRAQLQRAMDQAGEPRGQAAPTGMDESQCEWSDPKVQVTRTGRTAAIGGFNAEQMTILSSQSCQDRKTGAVCDVDLLMDLWLAPEMPGIEEATQFNRTYAQRMGYASATSRDATQRVEALFSRYKAAWEQASAQMQTLKGYPVRTRFELGFGGPRCQGSQASGTQSPGAGPPQSTPPSGADVQQSVATSAGQSAGESAAGRTGFGALAGQLGGKLMGGLFGRRQQQAQSSSASAQSAPSAPSASAAGSVGGPAAPASAESAPEDPLTAIGMLVPLRYTVEIVSISNRPLSADTFEVPADFKRVQAQQH